MTPDETPDEPCTCDHPRYEHGFALSKRGCFHDGCPCSGMPDRPEQ